MLFGDFLVKKGLIKNEDIIIARHVQEEANKQIGELALKQKLLNAKKVQHILEQQIISRKKFGEVAIDLKILTRKQVKDVLAFQKDYNIHIGEIFKYEGKLTAEDLEREIEEFALHREEKSSNGSGDT